MNLTWIALTLGLMAAVVTSGAEETVEYEYEDEAPTIQRNRPSLPTTRASKAIIAPPASRNKVAAPGKTAPIKTAGKTSTSTVPPEAQEEISDDSAAEVPEDQPEETSTEPPKKTLKPVVRPFRSNEDLLAALKRRREQVQNTGRVVEKSISTANPPTEQPKAAKSNSFGANGRRRTATGASANIAKAQHKAETPEPDPTKKSLHSRKYSRGNDKTSTPAAVEEDRSLEEQPKPKFGRGSRRPLP